MNQEMDDVLLESFVSLVQPWWNDSAVHCAGSASAYRRPFLERFSSGFARFLAIWRYWTSTAPICAGTLFRGPSVTCVHPGPQVSEAYGRCTVSHRVQPSSPWILFLCVGLL